MSLTVGVSSDKPSAMLLAPMRLSRATVLALVQILFGVVFVYCFFGAPFILGRAVVFPILNPIGWVLLFLAGWQLREGALMATTLVARRPLGLSVVDGRITYMIGKDSRMALVDLATVRLLYREPTFSLGPFIRLTSRYGRQVDIPTQLFVEDPSTITARLKALANRAQIWDPL